ncbi:MAG: DUF402 domain-containing protein [Sarcina sp.]
MLKRKWFDRREISDKILEKRFKFIKREDDDFNGYIGYLNVDKAYKTLIGNVCGKDRSLLKNGHSWLQWLEEDKNYSVIAIFDENKVLIEWYIDIILSQGLDSDGIPYYDDLYLDVVIFPTDGASTFLDEDELLDALEKGIITKKDYDLAYKVGNHLLDKYITNMDLQIQYTYNLLKFIE